MGLSCGVPLCRRDPLACDEGTAVFLGDRVAGAALGAASMAAAITTVVRNREYARDGAGDRLRPDDRGGVAGVPRRTTSSP